ncbi:hypothetical protein NITHO_1550003 [Nitrolancea hollandica Lb]|uniref:Uncharacterized protein n=1 Tax=Nitrolancea hollandica Lb TaxID=1129897 RepID=I4EDK2_9BACT|nr:hypothetical protein NITHO_1550003 [Nitrolancea hollandica Lb]
MGVAGAARWTYLEPGSPVLRFPPYQEMKISTASTAIRAPNAVASMHYSLSLSLQQPSPLGDVHYDHALDLETPETHGALPVPYDQQ